MHVESCSSSSSGCQRALYHGKEYTLCPLIRRRQKKKKKKTIFVLPFLLSFFILLPFVIAHRQIVRIERYVCMCSRPLPKAVRYTWAERCGCCWRLAVGYGFGRNKIVRKLKAFGIFRRMFLFFSFFCLYIGVIATRGTVSVWSRKRTKLGEFGVAHVNTSNNF